MHSFFIISTSPGVCLFGRTYDLVSGWQCAQPVEFPLGPSTLCCLHGLVVAQVATHFPACEWMPTSRVVSSILGGLFNSEGYCHGNFILH